MQEWIETNDVEPLTIVRLAAHAGMGERTLKQRFRQATGLSAIQYLQLVRIDKAKKLLIATGKRVKEIAGDVGYENTSFFMRLFRGEVGRTPAQWLIRVLEAHLFTNTTLGCVRHSKALFDLSRMRLGGC